MVKTAGFHRLPNTGLFTWNYLPGGATLREHSSSFMAPRR